MTSPNQLHDYLNTHWIVDPYTVIVDFASWVNNLNKPGPAKPKAASYANRYVAKPKATVMATAAPLGTTAGKRAAATRKAASTWVTVDNKQYIKLSRHASGGVRVPRSFVEKQLNALPGDSLLIVGSKGIKPTNAYVRKDGSLYVTSKLVSTFSSDVFFVRADQGHLVVKA